MKTHGTTSTRYEVRFAVDERGEVDDLAHALTETDQKRAALASEIEQAVRDIDDVQWSRVGAGHLIVVVQIEDKNKGLGTTDGYFAGLIERLIAGLVIHEELAGGSVEVSWQPRRLTDGVDLRQGAGSVTRRGIEQIGQGSDPPTASLTPRENFAEASTSDLVEMLVPEVPQAAIERLNELISDAQQTPPEDRMGFVRDVNMILDGRMLRLRVEGEAHLARLAIKKGSISLAVAGGRGQQGFCSKVIEVVPVSSGYAMRGARPSCE